MFAGMLTSTMGKETSPLRFVLIVFFVTIPLLPSMVKWTNAKFIGISSEFFTPTHT